MAKNKQADAGEEKISPMLRQYLQIKERYKGYILFFRLGDFYEMFFDDAELVSRELELALTKRAGSPMCGVPFHSSETYLKKLIDKGYKVAICEQLTDPHASKGLVERDVIRLVTAGTVIEASMLSEDNNNYIGCIYPEKDHIAVIFADMSTGEVHAFEKTGKNREEEVISELSRYDPVELLVTKDFEGLKRVSSFSARLQHCVCEVLEDEYFSDADISVVTQQFDAGVTLQSLGIASMPLVQKALCALFRYIGYTQKSFVKRFVDVKVHTDSEYLGINLTARRNLELTETMRSKEKRGSLLWVLDKTVTGLGKRRLHTWVEQPLLKHAEILNRLDAVEELCSNNALLGEIRETLGGVYDLERLMTRVMYKSAKPKDIVMLGTACSHFPALKKLLGGMSSRLLTALNGSISELSDLSSLIGNAIDLDKDGGIIRAGFNAEIDRLYKIRKDCGGVIKEMEESERRKTGIRTLRIGYNRIYGYYIEVSNSFKEQVPANYERKQTLTTGERYITDELKKLESEILGASEKLEALENEIFAEICDFAAGKLEEIQATARAVSEVDALCSFALVSVQNGYVRPEITLDSVIDIKDGRHPVVERIFTDKPFTPNDVRLDLAENRLIIITGPNMSGKSTFMRQTALIVIMAQMGCFVPARYAKIGVVDKIFTRVGASDDLSAGQSTFMVEMTEVADILKNATRSSLVILDEIGRGTSTFDGISIAKSVAEFICGKSIGCKTLFATHYHELISMEKEYEGVRNFSVAVTKRGDEIKFLHKIVEGGTDDSYGIEVAKLAGLPAKVISRAKEELREMEITGKVKLAEAIEKSADAQFSFAAVNEQNVIARLRAADVNGMTPIDALMFVKELKDTLQ